MSKPVVKVLVHHAQPVGSQRVPPFSIRGLRPLPSNTTVESSQAMQKHEAFAIVDALYHCLPGGTLDKVFAEMARRLASSLVVPKRQRR